MVKVIESDIHQICELSLLIIGWHKSEDSLIVYVGYQWISELPQLPITMSECTLLIILAETYIHQSTSCYLTLLEIPAN